MSEPQRRRYSWADYVYPAAAGEREVLRNKLGLTVADELFAAERDLTALRAFELTQRPELVPRTFDTAHWRGIHRQLFQDVYEWAGEFRTVDMGKASHGFVPAAQLDGFAATILGQVRAAGMFAGRDQAGVVDGLTHTVQALNLIHPFREGNGRTQRLLADHIAEQAGFLLDWTRISPVGQNVMMSLAFDGDLAMLQSALAQAIVPVVRGGAGDHAPWPDTPVTPDRAPQFWQLPNSGGSALEQSRSRRDNGGTATRDAGPSRAASPTPGPGLGR